MFPSSLVIRATPLPLLFILLIVCFDIAIVLSLRWFGPLIIFLFVFQPSFSYYECINFELLPLLLRWGVPFILVIWAMTVANLGLSTLYNLSTAFRSMVWTCTIFLKLGPFFLAVFFLILVLCLFLLILRPRMVLIVLAGKPSRFLQSFELDMLMSCLPLYVYVWECLLCYLRIGTFFSLL